MNNKLVINANLLRKESEFRTNVCIVEKAIAVSHSEFESLKRNPLQHNDLIGESLEQKPIKTSDGNIYVSFWQCDNWTLQTMDEMNEGQSEDMTEEPNMDMTI